VHALVAVVAHQQVLSLLTLTAAEEEEVRGRRKGRGRRRNSPFITDYAGLTVVAGPTAMARLDTPRCGFPVKFLSVYPCSHLASCTFLHPLKPSHPGLPAENLILSPF